LAQKWGLTSQLPPGHPGLSQTLYNGKVYQPQISLKPAPYANYFPLSISGCVLWLDAADASSITGTSPVTAWKDKSGKNNTFTYTGSPTYRTSSTLNNLGCITFNGTTTYNSGTDTMYWSAFTLSQPYSIFVVSTQRISANAALSFIIESAVGGTAVLLYTYGLNLTIFAGSGNIQTDPVLPFTANVPHVYSAIYNSSSSLLGYDGNSTSPINPGTVNWPGIYLGRDWSGVYQSADYGEIIFYSRALSTSERQNIEGYLTWKWGLQSSLPVTHPYYSAPPLQYTRGAILPPPTLNATGSASYANTAYYNVSPQAWNYNWQPYLNSMAAANSSGVTVTTSNIIGTPFTGNSWRAGGALGPNGNMYFLPQATLSILVFTPSTGTSTTITGGATLISGGWTGGVLAPNGNIYFCPYVATNILVLNTTTGATSNLTGDATFTQYGWLGGVLAPNGKIYFIPNSCGNFLVVDPITGTTSNLSGGGAAYTSGGYTGGCLGPDGNIYCTPYSPANVLVLNPSTGATYTLTGTASFVNAGWAGNGILARNGNIYMAPSGATTILVVNPIAQTVTTTIAAGGNGWFGGVLGPNGNIYFTPQTTSSILVLNPTTGATSTLTGGASFTAQNWQNGCLAPNGNIYAMSLTVGGGILQITFAGLSQLPALNYCLSGYANHC
jgi:streptogramin lyase